jgi:sugar O-acyltransferase (sialic acid O-acetyltransferase NeuD family)
MDNVIYAPEYSTTTRGIIPEIQYRLLSPIVFGTGELARVAESYIKKLYNETFDPNLVEYNIVRTVDSSYIKFDDKYTIPFERIQVKDGAFSHIFIPIGYKNCNKTREEKTKQAKEKGFSIMSLHDSKANIHSDTTIGIGCWIQEGCNVQTGSTIGEGTIMWASSHIGHGSNVGDFCWITTHATICGEVSIDNNTFIGANAVITPGVSVGKRCIIGSGAIITRDLPDDSVAIEGRNNIIAKRSYELNMR